MDRRKNYYMVLDTETANGFIDELGKLNLDYSLVYDIGFQVIDKKGNVYVKKSYAVEEVFEDMKDLMKSAYYAEKIPSYYDEISKGDRKIMSIWTIRKEIKVLLDLYNIKAVSAHNARFDYNALNNTVRYISGSACRWFFPYGTTIWDTLKMSRQAYGAEKGYASFCKNNGYLTRHSTPQNRYTAEILFRYISGDNNFEEVHKGINDVEIESKILVAILKKHRKIDKELFKKIA